MSIRLRDAALARPVPLLPSTIVAPVAARYIAGATIEEAIGVALRLGRTGTSATLDILGESVQTESEAAAHAAQYADLLAALETARIIPHVSVKPSALGSLFSWDTCEHFVRAIVTDAESRGGTVCLDMEASLTTDATLALYRRLRNEGHENVETVIQARLFRSENDIADLADLKPRLRICKGIYPEPATIAHTDANPIRSQFVRCVDAAIDTGCRVQIATHDEALIAHARERIRQDRLPPQRYEFQMLLGVREDAARTLIAAGHPVRVYVPFGPDWHAYSIRRLRESPQVAGYIASSTLHSLTLAMRSLAPKAQRR